MELTAPRTNSNASSQQSEESQAYNVLKSLFDQTRKVYSREIPFIDAIEIQMFQPQQQEIIRKANIATFLTSIFGAHDVSFYHLDQFFLDTFVPLGHRLLKWQGEILLELKTQSYISALLNSDGSPEALLDELFPTDLDSRILTRHPDAPSLSPSEQDFIDRSHARKNYLLAENSTDEAKRDLPRKYQWSKFVREFVSCVSKNVEAILNTPSRGLPQGGNNSTNKQQQQPSSATAAAAASALETLNKRSGTHTASTNDTAEDHPRPRPPAGSQAQRQKWTPPEEEALLDGLSRVNGPHWAQILMLYGRGGSLSEVLKDRNQVQLKDKARNLKLWHLKMGREVPTALAGVTGELRSG